MWQQSQQTEVIDLENIIISWSSFKNIWQKAPGSALAAEPELSEEVTERNQTLSLSKISQVQFGWLVPSMY